jgi:hypothetical protein
MVATEHRRAPVIHIPKPPEYNIQFFRRATHPNSSAAIASGARAIFLTAKKHFKIHALLR